MVKSTTTGITSDDATGSDEAGGIGRLLNVQTITADGAIRPDTDQAIIEGGTTITMPVARDGVLEVKNISGVTVTLDPGANTFETGSGLLSDEAERRFLLHGSVWLEK